MPIVFEDRVRETTTTTGTGDLTLSGATSGYKSFSTGIGVGNKCYYTISLSTDWESGIGTLSSSSILQRTTVLASSLPAQAYFSGGDTGSNNTVATADKLSFATNVTIAKTTANLSLPIQALGGVSEGSTKGYFAGGQTAGLSSAKADKLIFATDTDAAQTTANLTQARTDVSGLNGDTSKGYFSGGQTSGGQTTKTDKLVYSTDTTAVQTTANLSLARYDMGAVSEGTTKGYFAGGQSGTLLTQADKLTFSSDTTVSQTTANLSQARWQLAGTSGDTTKGYFAGGITIAGVATAEKITYSSDVTSAQTTANLTQARFALAGASESSAGSSGFFTGGSTNNDVTTADKITFATDVTSAQTTANLSQARHLLAGIGAGAASVKSVSFPSGTKNVIADAAATFLTQARGATDNTFTAGESLALNDCVYVNTDGLVWKVDADVVQAGFKAWIVGFAMEAASAAAQVQVRNVGILGGFSSLTTGRIQYISETAGAITETPPTRPVAIGVALTATEVLLNSQGLPQVQPYIAGLKGYFGGGNTNIAVTTANKITFSTDTTTAQTSANLSSARDGLAGVSQGGGAKGYFAGGAALATTDKVTFSTDATTVQTSANLSSARSALAGLSERSVKGYFCGGSSGLSAVGDKITFNTDTTAAQTTANLSQARGDLAALSEGTTKGYFAGGNIGSIVATVDKTTFSNDTTTSQTSSNLSQARLGVTGCSEGVTKGYFAGGDTGASVAVADKILFYTDTTTAQVSANLVAQRSRLGALSEGSTKGYFAGGITAGTVQSSTYKLIFSTDTTSAQTSANLTQARQGLAGLSDVAL